MNKIKYIISVTTLGTPLLAFAATTATVKTLAGSIATYLNQILLLLMGVAVVMFVWYVIQYFIRPNEGSESRTKAAQYLGWSLGGFFVIFAMWGIVNILVSTFNIGGSAPSSWDNLSNLFPQ